MINFLFTDASYPQQLCGWEIPHARDRAVTPAAVPWLAPACLWGSPAAESGVDQPRQCLRAPVRTICTTPHVYRTHVVSCTQLEFTATLTSVMFMCSWVSVSHLTSTSSSPSTSPATFHATHWWCTLDVVDNCCTYSDSHTVSVVADRYVGYQGIANKRSASLF